MIYAISEKCSESKPVNEERLNMPYIVSREEDHKKTAPLMGALHHHIQMEAGPDAPLKNPETEGTYEIHPVDIT